VKLQQAYFSESNKIGGWSLIGYAAPGTSSAGDNGAANTTNFRYTGGINASATSEASGASVTQNVWNAASLVALNDCVKGSTWTVAAVVGSAEVSFNSAVPTGTGCAGLTPTFDKIGK
jgi:hypothetical protein